MMLLEKVRRIIVVTGWVEHFRSQGFSQLD